MESQPSHAAPGRQRSSPRPCWLIWSGGGRTLILCVLMHHCEWHLRSREHEVASAWRSATGTVPLPWLREEPLDDGQRARCSRVPWCRSPLEKRQSQRGIECEIAGRLAKVLAEARGCRLTRGSEGLSGLQHHPKLAPSRFEESWSISPPCPMAAPPPR
jgi:hypothetical protein